MTLGQRVRALRGTMTQGELSRRSGLKQAHISRIENDHFEGLTSETVVALARGLSVNVGQIIGDESGVGKSGEVRPDIYAVLREYDLEPHQLSAVGTILNSMNKDIPLLVPVAVSGG